MHQCMFEAGPKKKRAFKSLLQVYVRPPLPKAPEVEKKAYNKEIKERRNTLLALSGLLGHSVDMSFEVFKLKALGLSDQQKFIGALMSISAKQATYTEELRIAKRVL